MFVKRCNVINFNNICSVINRRAEAVAFLIGSDKYRSIQGRVLFYNLRDLVLVRAEVSGLPQSEEPCQSPIFAFHIHEGGECTGNSEDQFANAGAHYNPWDCPHPYHAGDLPPLTGVNGDAFSMFITNRFTVPEVIGKTVIIHAHPDDFHTQPSGNSGEKIACGIIRPTARLSGFRF